MVSEEERELLSKHLGVGLVDLELVTVGGRREGINTPSGPNGRISAAVPHLTRGTAALMVWHYRTC
jgi:hypothetical protein